MRYPALLAAGLGLAALTPAAAQPAAPPLAYVQPLPSAAVQNVQDRLRQAGVYTGRIDGIWGADSQAALERFQQAHQLQVTGQLNQATAATLGLDPGALVATPAAAPAAPPPPADRLLPGSVRAVQARLGSLGFYSGGGRRVGRGHAGRDPELPAGAGPAAGRPARTGDDHGDGAGTGGAGVPVACLGAVSQSRLAIRFSMRRDDVGDRVLAVHGVFPPTKRMRGAAPPRI
jgi:N-acetylmuramoyl-L-alanine amidase